MQHRPAPSAPLQPDPALLADLPGWSLADAGLALSRTYRFGQYLDGIAFVNRIAQFAEAEDHHPALIVGWREVTVRWTTHDAGGLTERDLRCAKLTDQAAA